MPHLWPVHCDLGQHVGRQGGREGGRDAGGGAPGASLPVGEHLVVHRGEEPLRVVPGLLSVRENSKSDSDCFWAMSQQRQNARMGNFGSSNARVSGRDFRYSWQGLFYRVEETD